MTDPTPLDCHDCGEPYDGNRWVEYCLPADDWAAISPTGGHGGLLCLACAVARLRAADRAGVPLLISPGQFAHDPHYWWLAGFDAGRRTAQEDR